MFDLSSEFEKFYCDEVVLPQDAQNDLRAKRNTNIRRLKSGLKEYNEEHGTSYSVSETFTQGSMAMHTVIQNDSNDYDIDVAIVFDSDNIKDLGALSVRNIVADAINRKKGNLGTEPEVKTNCVRIKYSNGYHVDFAVYRRTKNGNGTYSYEHGGSAWRSRDPKAISNWFSDQIKSKGAKLRKTVRLLKTFSKSRSSWIMPGGLIQTVLCDEQLSTGYDRLDETFYYLMKNIRDRLKIYIEVYNPTDTGVSLLLKQSDRDKMDNLKSRLDTYVAKLDVLFDSNCSKTDAYNAWHEVFNHDYWTLASVTESASLSKSAYERSAATFSNTEEFIEDEVNINEIYEVEIDCEATGDGFRTGPISTYIDRILKKFLPHNLSLKFYIKECNVPKPYDIWWKIRNVGPEAERRNCIRGDLLKTNLPERKESTNFFGSHFVECYIIKNGVCVAIGHIDVPIGHS
ncbi:MAG: cyclic GMP-AMP synthase DncV-like nucleotidyltransferase [Desulfitobacterium sp.]